jgi:restriction endonuclease S subunit
MNRYIRITDITDKGELKSNDLVSPSEVETKYFLKKDDLLIARSGSVGRTYLHARSDINYQWAGYLINFRLNKNIVLPSYVYYVTKSPLWWNWVVRYSKTGTLTNINAQEYSSFELPVPPLDIQRRIVDDLDAEKRFIDGNVKLIDIFQQKIIAKIAEVWGV